MKIFENSWIRSQLTSTLDRLDDFLERGKITFEQWCEKVAEVHSRVVSSPTSPREPAVTEIPAMKEDVKSAMKEAPVKIEAPVTEMQETLVKFEAPVTEMQEGQLKQEVSMAPAKIVSRVKS